MAFRSNALLKTMMKSLSGRSSSAAYATYAPAIDKLNLNRNLPKSRKGDFVPVYVAIGMIALSTSFGLHAAAQQLKRAPNVFVKKSRRETLPELVEPEHVAEKSDEFVRKSIFRKVAHFKQLVHNKFRVPDTAGCLYTAEPPVETLKSVGVEPKP